MVTRAARMHVRAARRSQPRGLGEYDRVRVGTNVFFTRLAGFGLKPGLAGLALDFLAAFFLGMVMVVCATCFLLPICQQPSGGVSLTRPIHSN